MPTSDLKKKRKNPRKTARLLFVFVIILTIVLTLFLLYAQVGLSAYHQRTNSKSKLVTIENELSLIEADFAKTRAICDDLYISKVKCAAFLIKNGWTYDCDKLREMASVMGCENLFVITNDGKTLCAAYEDKTNFSRARFNQLDTAYDEEMQPFSITRDGIEYRYCAADLDGNSLVVAVIDTTPSKAIAESSNAIITALENVKIGLNGFAFSISRLDYTFTYYPDNALIGASVLSHGITSNAFRDEFDGLMEINGQSYFCIGKRIENNYVYCAVSVSELVISSIVVVIAMLIAFLIVVLLLSGYAVEISKELLGDHRLREENRNTKAYRKVLRERFQHRLRPVAVLGLIGVLILTYYLQTLFALGRQSGANVARSNDVVNELEWYDAFSELSEDWYTDEYLTKCKTAAYILTQTDMENENIEFMRDLADRLGVEEVYHFNTNGKVVSTSSELWDFKLSEDPESQSYPFRDIINGTKLEYVQETQTNEYNNADAQYIGCAMKNEAHHVTGMAQLQLKPYQLQTLRSRSSVSTVLSTMHYGMDTFVFAVNKEDNTFTYFPDTALIGKPALEYGLSESNLTDNVTGFLTIEDTRYFFKSVETEDYYLFVATPMSSITRMRFAMTLVNGGAVCVALILILVFMEFAVVRRVAPNRKGKANDDYLIEFIPESAPVAKTRGRKTKWSIFKKTGVKTTAAQRILSVIRHLIMLFATTVSLIMVFAERILAPNSMLLYILNGNWERNISIFSVTKCILVAIIIFTISMVFHTIMRWLSEVSNSRGITTCRMLDNFVRFGCIVALIYIDLDLLGVDTATMLASAGIFSLVIGLGVQSLISDIIAGLFIVFDGEFQVGDIITVDNFRGIVLEIGVRTVKVRADDGNVKIFSNRNVTNVLNMTQELSLVRCRVGTEYGDDLSFIEETLSRELPEVAKRIPQLKDGPTYLGVVELAAGSVDLLIVGHCIESDRFIVERALNREIKLIFDRNGINIPFPQIVINEREKA